jgi:hypothetical protein
MYFSDHLFFAPETIDGILHRPEGDLRVPETGASPREPPGCNQSLRQLGGSELFGWIFGQGRSRQRAFSAL